MESHPASFSKSSPLMQAAKALVQVKINVSVINGSIKIKNIGLYIIYNFDFFVLSPGHEESYNPPPEYLPTEEEVMLNKLKVFVFADLLYILSKRHHC